MTTTELSVLTAGAHPFYLNGFFSFWQ